MESPIAVAMQRSPLPLRQTPYGRFWIGKCESADTGTKERRICMSPKRTSRFARNDKLPANREKDRSASDPSASALAPYRAC